MNIPLHMSLMLIRQALIKETFNTHSPDTDDSSSEEVSSNGRVTMCIMCI